ncbi:MAG TPA: MFS transporter [Candidatus Dormibacteraeota bacterium]|jgi:MFS family permease|nr:MFS transporter [Candidatus Dormibacteraeota bacterium]
MSATSMRPRLRRPGAFTLLWTGQAVSEVGSQVTVLAFPTLAVLGFHAGPAAVGLLIAAARLPFPVLSLVAGALVDRVRKRPLMIACNLGRIAILVVVPVLSTAGVLQLWHLYVATAGMGVFTVFFDIAYLALVPALVDQDQLLRANSRLEVTFSAATLAGPGLGGLLVQALGAARAVLADAASFAVSVVTLLGIRHQETVHTAEERHLLREVGEGLRHVFGNRVLRAQILCMGAAGIFVHAWEGPFYLFAYDRLHMSPGLLGAVLASEGVGAIAATFVAARVTRRLGPGPAILYLDGLAIGLAVFIPLAAVVSPAAVLFPLFIVIGAAGTIGNIAQVTLRQSLSPPHLQGRMTSVFRTVFWGVWPLGNLLGGLVASRIGTVTTIWTTALLGFLANASIRFTPLWRVRSLEAAVAESAPPLGPLHGGTLEMDLAMQSPQRVEDP